MVILGIRNGGAILRREKTKYTRKVQKLVFRLFSFCAAKIFISSGSESCSVYSLYVFGWRCYDEAYFFSWTTTMPGRCLFGGKRTNGKLFPLLMVVGSGRGSKNAEFWIFDSKRSSHLNTKNQMEHENLLCNLHKELAKNETNVKENDEQKQPDGKE